MRHLPILALLLFPSIGYSQGVSIDQQGQSGSPNVTSGDGACENGVELYIPGSGTANPKGTDRTNRSVSPFMSIPTYVTIEPKKHLQENVSGSEQAHGLHPAMHQKGSIARVLANSSSIGTGVNPALAVNPTPKPAFTRGQGENNHLLTLNQNAPGSANINPSKAVALAPPTISHQSGWYTSDIQVTLSDPLQSGTILYTLDGSEPNIANVGGAGTPFLVNYYSPGQPSSINAPMWDRTFIYTGPITITNRSMDENVLSNIITTYYNTPNTIWNPPSGRVFKGTTLRASVYSGATQGPTTTVSYFISPQGGARYTLPTVSFTISPRDLVGYNQGIYVPGTNYFANGGTESSYPGNYGNFFMEGTEWEKVLDMNFFNGDGGFEFGQELGVRIHGGSLQRNPLKPFRLYSRNNQGAGMQYPFIPSAINQVTGRVMANYQRLLIRSGGNQRDHLTDVTAHIIMSPSQLGVQHSQPVIHFFNGEYWGITYLRDRQDEHHVANTYGLEPENVILLNAPWGLAAPDDVEAGTPDDLLLYRNLYTYALTNDLSNPTHYSHITTLLDVMSYIDYQVMFIFLNNADWYGSKHFRFWRARSTNSKPFHDGRWRIMVWDFDLYGQLSRVGYDLLANAIHPTGGGPGPFQFDNLPQRTALLRSLLASPDFRNLFINRFADHMNTTLHPSRIEAVVEEQYQLIEPEMPEHFLRWGIPATSRVTVDELVNFARQRPAHQRNHLRNHFGLGADATLTLGVSGQRHGHIRVNTIHIKSETAGVGKAPYPWTGIYFQGVPVELEAIPGPGYRFMGWEGLPPGTPALTKLSLSGSETTIRAIFESTRESIPLHTWHFNNLPEGSITSAPTDLAAIPNGLITYPGSGAGYMDRVNEGASLNSPPNTPSGNALRVRNPSQARELLLALPTTGYDSLELSYATTRTQSGAEFQTLWYRTTTNGPWNELASNIAINQEYKLVSIPLFGIADANSNPEFAIRITFSGPNASGGSGNNRFDNIILKGKASQANPAPAHRPSPGKLNAWYSHGRLAVHNPYGTAMVQVFDITGRIIMQREALQHGENSIPFDAQPGMLIVKLTHGLQVLSGRVWVGN